MSKTGLIIKFSFMLFFLIFLVIGVCMLGSVVNYKTNGVKTKAEILSIDREYSGRDSNGRSEYDYTVMVQYYANDELYIEELHSYSSSMRVGKEITIYYMPDKPYKIMYPGVVNLIGMIFSIVGGIGELVVVIILICSSLKKRA